MRAQRWQARGSAGVADLEFVETELDAPGPGEVIIRAQAAGVNPADLKHAQRATAFPWPLGYEVAGEIVALGPHTQLASGGGRLGDAVMAFRVRGGFATALRVPARDVFARPASLAVTDAATMLLAATTAADMLRAVRVGAGDTVLITGASGAVGHAAIQLARRAGARVVAVTGPHGEQAVSALGAEYAPRGFPVHTRIDAALDTTGAPADVDLCRDLVADRSRIVTIAAPARAASDGFTALAGTQATSATFRDGARGELIELAATGQLRSPPVTTWPLADAPAALARVASGRAGGKIALVT